MTKPPIGVMPHDIWLSNRIIELSTAITSYTQADVKNNITLHMMDKWAFQLNRLMSEYVTSRVDWNRK